MSEDRKEDHALVNRLSINDRLKVEKRPRVVGRINFNRRPEEVSFTGFTPDGRTHHLEFPVGM